jgi:ABC-type phosphate transport system permease subunit
MQPSPLLIFQISYQVVLVTLGTLQNFTLSEGLAGDAWEPSEQNQNQNQGGAPLLVSFATLPSFFLSLSIIISRLPLWSSGQSSWLQNGDVLCSL